MIRRRTLSTGLMILADTELGMFAVQGTANQMTGAQQLLSEPLHTAAPIFTLATAMLFGARLTMRVADYLHHRRQAQNERHLSAWEREQRGDAHHEVPRAEPEETPDGYIYPTVRAYDRAEPR